MINFLKQNDTEFEFYNRILIADDFLNCIFVWNIFESFVQKSLSTINNDDLAQLDSYQTPNQKNILYSSTIKEWCAKNYIAYNGLLNMIAARDQLIENMITIGLNPYKNSLNIPKNSYNINKILRNSLEEGLIEVKKIKSCIYEGFKCNVLTKYKNMYQLLIRNININVKSIYTEEIGENVEQKKPMYIIVDNYMLSQKMGMARFEFVADGYVSVLDNFIDVDENFYKF